MAGKATSGPMPKAFHIRARYLLEKAKGLQVAADVIEGKLTEDRVTKDGVVEVRPSIANRLEAVKLLAETGRVLVKQVEDVTPVTRRSSLDLVAMVPAILGALQVGQQERLKLLEAVTDDVEVVG